ncbi:MAG: hypothetical protein IPL43_02375 [Micropruina sp.]|nr:hypothetical protein [Micropruina sp.]
MPAVAWTVAVLVAISGTVTRIMAIPAVNTRLTRVLNLGALPQTTPEESHAEDDPMDSTQRNVAG